MGNNQQKQQHSRHPKSPKSPNRQTHVEESFDPNLKIKERACYDILMRTNRDKPRPPRDPNQPYDSVKSDEVLIRPDTAVPAVQGRDSNGSLTAKAPDAFRERRMSKDEWMLRVKEHGTNSEAMKDHLQYDSHRIRKSYQHKLSVDSGAPKKRQMTRQYIRGQVTEYTTDDEEAKRSLDYPKPKDQTKFKRI